MKEENKMNSVSPLHFVRRIFGAIIIVWLVCYWSFDRPITSDSHEDQPKELWTGYDPNRPVTDIGEVDYNNMSVTYRAYRNANEKKHRKKMMIGNNLSQKV